MFTINKITSHTTVDFAAEELKKYLRMMMPRRGEMPVAYAPLAQDGFRLGLMSDFGLDISDAEDPALDDIIYIDTDENGGIIAGSNPGALLIAVYRYLRFQDCRWVFPGVDGEIIPLKDGVVPVRYRKKATHRYRGQCNEGAEFQQNMMETIDFTPKIGMNTYMLEFDIPFVYYNSYYSHVGNTVREPEPVTNEQVLQWKRQCEVEIQKRGLHFHDMGHGWTNEPFGLDSKHRGDLPPVPEEVRPFLAMVDGERKFHRRVVDTNVCMSNPKVRDIMAQYIADYAETQNNVDFLHIWLADGTKNHCECEECRKKTPSDWYVMMLNDTDAELTRRGLDTHLVFIVYTETFWAPLEEKLNNKKRFTMLYAPIFRKYTETYGETPDPSQLTPFTLNNNVNPRGMGACLAYLNEWKKLWEGDCFCYEYHFWRHQAYDPSNMYLSKLIYDDIKAQKQNGLEGIVEDGSQRSYFPTGFPFYVYGETLYDASVSYEELKEDYFSHAYGKDYKQVIEYLEKLSSLVDFGYMSGHYGYEYPEILPSLREVNKVVEDFAPVIEANKNQPLRAQTVAWRLLEAHKDYVIGVAESMAFLAEGKRAEARARFDALIDEFSKREIYLQNYFDLRIMVYSLDGRFGPRA
nr:DUF4838 domain-containing protein [Clostridia bacterium]